MGSRPGCLPQKPCNECGCDIDYRVKSGLCKVCARKPCLDCGRLTGPANQTGYCAHCSTIRLNRDPAHTALRVAGIRRKMETDPAYMAQQVRNGRRLGQKSALDPELRARRVEHGKRVYRELLCRPDVVARRDATLKAQGPRISERWMSWCPEKYRELHRHNTRKLKMTLAESKAIILPMVADDEALKHIDSALEYLKRLAPVGKLENGYRYGNAVLRPSEVIDRAKLRGWQPDRWAA